MRTWLVFAACLAPFLLASGCGRLRLERLTGGGPGPGTGDGAVSGLDGAALAGATPTDGPVRPDGGFPTDGSLREDGALVPRGWPITFGGAGSDRALAVRARPG